MVGMFPMDGFEKALAGPRHLGPAILFERNVRGAFAAGVDGEGGPLKIGVADRDMPTVVDINPVGPAIADRDSFDGDVLELGAVEPVGDVATARSVTAHLHAMLPIRSRAPETWRAFEGTLYLLLGVDTNVKAALYNTHSEDHRGRLALLSRSETNEHFALFIHFSY